MRKCMAMGRWRIIIDGRERFAAATQTAPVDRDSTGPVERRTVRSSSVVSVGYDPPARTLDVEFRTGRIYRYFDVPPLVYSDLLNADSIGGFINRSIKGRFSCRRI